jgi:hypothetical protein
MTGDLHARQAALGKDLTNVFLFLAPAKERGKDGRKGK